MVPLDVLLSQTWLRYVFERGKPRSGRSGLKSGCSHAVPDQFDLRAAGIPCMLFFFTVGKPHQVRTLRGAATAGCSSSLQRLAGGEAAFSVSLSSCCSAFGSAGSEAGGLAESSTGCEALRRRRALPLHASLAQIGWERRCSGRQLLSRLRRSLRCSGLRLSCSLWELEDSSADFDSALPSSRASSGSSHFTFCIGKPGGSSSSLCGQLRLVLTCRACAGSRRGLGFATVTSLPAFCAEPFRLLALLLRRRWPWRCAGGAGTCGHRGEVGDLVLQGGEPPPPTALSGLPAFPPLSAGLAGKRRVGPSPSSVLLTSCPVALPA